MRSPTDPAPAWGLVEALASPDVRRRMAAVSALRALGRSAAPALERGLVHDSRPVVRRWCAHLLGLMPGRGSASAILTGTQDPLAIVRLLSMQALAARTERGDMGLDPVPHMVRLARHDRSKRVRHAALEILAARARDPRAAACLLDAATDPAVPEDLRRSCMRAARALPDRRTTLATVGF